MRRDNAIFGGEHSGHFYFRDIWFADSSLIAFLLILELLSVENKPLSELIKPLDTRGGRSCEINTQVNDVQSMLRSIEKHFGRDARSVDHLDGLTFDYGDWWFNVRPSNTEPLLRLNVEAKTRPLLEKKRDELVEFIRG
jgi:phosphomannomutase